MKIDTVNSKWETTPEENEIIHAVTSAKDKNLWYNPSYRRQAWDGVVKMFNPKAGTLPAGLVQDAVEALEAAGFPVEISYKPHRDFQDRPEAEIYYDLDTGHQLRALEALCTHKRGIIHAATNAGKTKIAQAWCALNDFKILYLVPSKELLRQTIASFKQDTNLSVGQISAEEGWDLGKDVTVALVSSVSKKKSKKTGLLTNQKAVERFKEVAKEFEAVIVDECHHMTAEGWRWVLKCCVNAHYRYGLSGTPWEPKDLVSALRVKSFLGPIIATVSNAELIDKGWSARPLIHMVPVHSTPIEVPERGEDEEILFGEEVYDPGIVYNDLRNNMIAKLCQQFYDKNEICLVMSTRLAQCDILSQTLKMKRIPHRVITGETPKEDRETDLQDFRERKYSVLISSVMSEGVDIPSLNGLIFAAGGKSSKLLLQRVGRGVRKKTSGENVVAIYDFVDYAHGILLNHTKKRIKLYESEGFEVFEAPVRF